MIYHVSKQGNDRYIGTEEAPFLTINRAARVAAAGDTVVVHEGVYREWVDPKNGGLNDLCRITYTAAEGEKCDRCWNYTTSGTKTEDGGCLCPRCLSVLSAN